MPIFPSFDEFKSGFEEGMNQVVHSLLASDLDTPVSIMMKTASVGNYSFILESVTGGEIRGRYSIVGMNPDVIWKCRQDKVWINRSALSSGDNWSNDTDQPFDSLRKLLAESYIDLPKDLPSSSAGLFGYLGYDMIRLVEHLPEVNSDPLDLPDAILFRPTVVAVADGVKSEVRVVSPAWANCGLSAEEAYEEASQRVLDTIQKIETHKEFYHRHLGESQIQSEPISNLSQKSFMKIVDRAKDYIKAGDVFQVVPSQRWTQEFNLPPFSLYRALRRTNPSPFMFYFDLEDFQVIGASPEILVRVFGKEVTIRPIAGTRPRGATPVEDDILANDLLEDKKELAEHLMLLDLGRNDVGRVSRLGTVIATETFVVERYSHVMHIASNVVGELQEDQDALSALLAGLPAGTVSGAPKVRAMEIIDELEPEKRGVYAGGVGYFSANGDMDMCIALRTAVLKDKKLYIQAGGGIVHDSDPEKEWKETVNKSKALIKAAEDAAMFGKDEYFSPINDGNE